MRYVCALALIGAGATLIGADNKPSYSAASIVNSASNIPGMLAPNTLATVYGTGLSWEQPRELRPSDLRGGELPTTFPGVGVQVLVGGIPAHLLYVSDKQVNFLVPSDLTPGPVDFVLIRDSQRGPVTTVNLDTTAPALFLAGDPPAAIAVRLDGSLATPDAPLRPGDTAILFATGLGPTKPDAEYGKIALRATPLREPDLFEVTLDGVPLDSASVLYAGLAPGFAGLYQINLMVPDSIATDPEIRVSASGVQSSPGIRIYARPAE